MEQPSSLLTQTEKDKKLNLGCGRIHLVGYTNVDVSPPADILGDFRQMVFEDIVDVRMHHVLEHLPHAEGLPVLERIYLWMAPGASILIEVPDMEEICKYPYSPWFQSYVYGSQSDDGEYHKSGYTLRSLTTLVGAAGFKIEGWSSFTSDKPWRVTMPCVEVVGIK